MNVDIVLVDGGIKPIYATDGAAGADVFARLDNPVFIHPGETRLIPLGFKIEIPVMETIRLAAFLLPRSGLGNKHGIVLGNLVGTIDDDYRGEVMASIWNRNHDGEAFEIKHGDRIAQMVIQPVIRCDFNVVEMLSETRRGDGGFGHTG